MLGYFLQFLTGLSGFLLLYAGIFVYPDERRALHSKAEDLWLRWSEEAATYEGLFVRFGRTVASKFTNIFDTHFGPDLISRRSLMTSVVLSAWLSPGLAIFAASVVVLATAFNSSETRYVVLGLATAIALFYLFCRWIFGGVTRKTFIDKYSSSTLMFVSYFSTFVVVGPASIVVSVVLAKGGANAGTISLALAAVTALITVVLGSDIASIYFTRRILIGVLKATRTLRIAVAFLIDALLALAIAILPALLLLPFILSAEPGDISEFFALFAATALVMNVTTLAPTVAYLLCAFIFAINALLWPTVLRPMYSLVDNRVFDRRRSLASLGVLLLSGAISPGGISEIIKGMLSLVTP